mgnify:CR=1 FL=1
MEFLVLIGIGAFIWYTFLKKMCQDKIHETTLSTLEIAPNTKVNINPLKNRSTCLQTEVDHALDLQK